MKEAKKEAEQKALISSVLREAIATMSPPLITFLVACIAAFNESWKWAFIFGLVSVFLLALCGLVLLFTLTGRFLELFEKTCDELSKNYDGHTEDENAGNAHLN